jgi:hypothetical protein
MSLINDALLKAERDRTDAAIADAARLPPLARAEKIREQKRRRSLAPVFINAALLAGIFAVLIVLVLRPRTDSPAAADAPAPLLAVAQPTFAEPRRDGGPGQPDRRGRGGRRRAAARRPAGRAGGRRHAARA